MKKSVILFMSIMLVSLTGCDFLRSVAGRPTGKDIEAKRIAIIKAEEKALQDRLDSIRIAEEKVVSDSLAALDSFKTKGITISGTDRIGGLAGTELECRYYIIIGAFRTSTNAGKLFDVAFEKGYSPVLINCRSGMTAVGLAPADRIADVWATYGKLAEESFCPKESWILVNE